MSVDFLAPLVAAYESAVAEANKSAEKAQNSNEGQQAKSIKEWRENSDHPEAIAYREFYEKAQAAILKRREALAKTAAEELKFEAPMTEEEKKAEKEIYKEHAGLAKKSLSLIKDVAETLKVEVPTVTPLVNFGSGKPAGERTGSTGTRTRWSKVEWSLDGGETVVAKRLSDFVAEIKKVSGVTVSAQDVSKAIFEEAGTTDADKITDVNIKWSETKDDKTFSWDLSVFRDPKNKDSEESDDDSEDEVGDESLPMPGA